jgi:hypothetical protein
LLLPSGPLEGALPLGRVLRTLHNHEVAIHKQRAVTRLEKGDVIRSELFTEIVPRFIIQHLSRVFNIDITDFYEIPPIAGDLFREDDNDP